MFEKKTVLLTKVVPFANQPFFLVEKRYHLESGTKTVPKWGTGWSHFGSTFFFQCTCPSVQPGTNWNVYFEAAHFPSKSNDQFLIQSGKVFI